MRHCVCGTLNHEEGSADDKTAQLNNIHEDCIPSEENIDFHSDILKCNSSDAGSNPDVCKLGSCETNGYCFKWLVRDDSKITTTFGCLPEKLLQPRKRPFICYGSKVQCNLKIININISQSMFVFPISSFFLSLEPVKGGFKSESAG